MRHSSVYLLNSMRILHPSAFPDVHLCGVHTARLRKKTPTQNLAGRPENFPPHVVRFGGLKRGGVR